MNPQIPELRKALAKKLSSSRYEHSLSVSFTCVCLAMRYGYPLDTAELAGLAHDCAKCYSTQEMTQRCEKRGIPVTEAERQAPEVLHAKLGAVLARERYGILDPDILSAIACHTTGKPDMGLLDKILFTADYIEARRDKADNLAQMRRLAFVDLDEAVYQILKGTLQYLESRGGCIDPATRETFAWYCRRRAQNAGENGQNPPAET